MRLHKAIKILEEQKQKILNSNHPKNDEWIVETASYIKSFFGFNSIEYSRIAQFKWSVRTTHTSSNEEIKLLLKENMENIVLFLDNCKRTLKNKGLFRDSKNNLLSDKSNPTLIGILFTLSSIVFGIGFHFGTEKTNMELIRTENKLINLKDSLAIIITYYSPNKKEDVANIDKNNN